MRVYQVNVTGRFSTGTLANQIHKALLENGDSSRFAFGLGGETDENRIQAGNIWHQRLDNRFQRYFGKQGVFCGRTTKRIIADIKKFDPDIIHLHNIHGNYLNTDRFFHWLSEYGKPVMITLHDCWPFTGGCFHFTENRCDGWKSDCSDCRFLARPALAAKERAKKERQFASVDRLFVVTVSEWLKEMAEQSFLGNREITAIYNGIDTGIFSPGDASAKKKALGCEGKKILLGVASTWNERKGIGKWIRLSGMLGEEYRIVLVGMNEKQIAEMPDRIIALPRVKTAGELAELYNAADVYINMSLEETFGLPTAEAMACGTPAIVFSSTANPELITENTGIVCDTVTVDAVADAVKAIAKTEKSVWRDRCVSYARDRFSVSRMTEEYIRRYHHILTEA